MEKEARPPHEVPHLPEHAAMARSLVERTRANGGLAPVDLQRFWADDARASRDPFGKDIPQVPFGAWMNGLCVWEELGVPEDVWRYDHDHKWRAGLNRAYNDLSERIVGRRLLDEKLPPAPEDTWPWPGGLHDIFEAKNEWHGHSWWLKQSAGTPDELARLLDRVEERDIRKTVLPPEWDERKGKLLAKGLKPPLYRSQRGPVTFATSVYGPENLIFLIMEEEKLAARFRDAIINAMLGLAGILDEEAGYAPGAGPRGFYFMDDNCVLLNPAMYEFFGAPVLKAMFDRYSPGPRDLRGQHSDSAMGHHLPALGRLGLNNANFGPTVTVEEIRRYLPRAVISGALAPYTYSRNDGERIVLEFLRDFTMAREKRGLVFATAGSVNEGTRLTSMRLVMAAIQEFGRY
jgi:uroporphyrinogen decarboxylase